MNPGTMQSLIKKADVLIEALPYIREFNGCVFVIKYGGSAMVEDDLKEAVLLDILLLRLVGIKTVIVHGGGKKISAVLQRLGKKPQFIDGLRVTDGETMDVVEMVLCGQINKDIVATLNRHGGHAVGLSGKDNTTILARKKSGGIDLGHVGDIASINCDLPVTGLVAQPVRTPPEDKAMSHKKCRRVICLIGISSP